MIQAYFRLNVADVTGDHIKNREILGKGLRKTHIARCRHLQGKNFRKQHHRCQASRQQRIHSKLKAAANEFLPVHLLIQHQQGYEIQHHKNAGHDGDIIIRKNGHAERQAVKYSFSIFHQPLQPQNDQREQNNAVQPHNVPAICSHIARQGVKDTEKCHTKIVGPAMLS